MSLCALGLSEAAADIREGRITSAELVGDCLARIDAGRRRGAGLGLSRPRPRAARRPRRSTCSRREGKALGALHGVPIGIKDIFDTGDMPTELGSPLWAGRTPRRDAAAVSRLRSAGAVIMGKTVTTEYAYFHPGKTRNPHDRERTPGGSSSGSAAAVAACMVPGAIGSQTNGSVIRPAAFCGVVGFKPTHGLIPRTGALMLSRTLDHVGMFARSVEDVALLGRDACRLRRGGSRYATAGTTSLRGRGGERAAAAAAVCVRAFAGLEACRAGHEGGVRRARRRARRAGERGRARRKLRPRDRLASDDHGSRDGAQSSSRL